MSFLLGLFDNHKDNLFTKSIQKIDENNFYACTILETIYYEGTQDEWNAINNLFKDNF